MGFQQAAQNYRKNAILTAPPEKLVVLLYEGAIQNLEKSRVLLRGAGDPHSPAVGEALGKALAIVGELRSSLDMARGGEISGQLERLYEFSCAEILQANVDRRPEKIENVLTVLRTLKEGWDGILSRAL